MADLAHRREVIRALLERYEEFVDPMQSRADDGGGSGLVLMPATYTRSVRELENLLKRMRLANRFLWWHVTERYLRCTNVIREVRVERRVKGRGRVVTQEPRVVPIYNPRVIDSFVEDGLNWLAREWSLRSEPMLPDEVRVAPVDESFH